MTRPASRVALIVGLAIGALVVAGLVVQRGFDSLEQAYGWERHTQVVRHAIIATVAEIQQAETSQRGFVLTGEPSLLDGFARSDATVQANVARLRELTADNPGQQERLERLLAAWQTRHSLGQRTIDLVGAGKFDAATAIVKSGAGEEASRAIRAAAAEMEREEQALLQSRRAMAAWYETGLKTALLTLLAAVAALLAAGYLADRKDARGRAMASLHLEQQLAQTRAAEAALQRSEARWKFALEGGHQGVFDWDVDADRAFVSDTYKRLLRYDATDKVDDSQQTAMERVHPEDRPKLLAAIGSVLDGSRQEYGVEIRARCRDGQYIWVETRGLLTTTDGGRHVIGTIADVTVRRLQSDRIEALTIGLERTVLERTAELQQTAAQLRGVLDALSEGVIVLGADGAVVDANQSAAAILNVALDELLGSNITMGTEIVREDGGAYPRAELPPVIAITHGRSVRDAILGTTITGRGLRWMRAHAEPIVAQTGSDVRLAVVSFRDITEHRELERQLRESETRWRFAIEGAGDGLWDWSVPAGSVFFSKRWKALLGYAEHEVGSSLEEWSSRIHPDDLDETMALVGGTLAAGADYYVSEHRLSCKNGTYKWILDRGMVVSRDDEGRPLRVVGTHTDVTERKESEQAARRAADTLAATVHELDATNRKLDQHRSELEQIVSERTRDLREANEHLLLARDAAEQASRAKSAFLASVSHELRTPLNAVIGFSTLLQDGAPGELNPEQRHQTLLINQAGHRLLELVEDMISVAASQENQAPASNSAVPLKPLLERVVAGMQDRARQKSLALVASLEREDLRVRADPVRLHHVLVNLTANALKFTEKGHVRLSAARSGTYVRVAVEDTGVGIEPDKINQLFQPFARISSRPGRVYDGTGLGLAVCRQLVESMQGRIGATSDSGNGSTFWVELPDDEAVN
jgi:PAS domain S-box-containing protein